MAPEHQDSLAGPPPATSGRSAPQPLHTAPEAAQLGQVAQLAQYIVQQARDTAAHLERHAQEVLTHARTEARDLLRKAEQQANDLEREAREYGEEALRVPPPVVDGQKLPSSDASKPAKSDRVRLAK